MTEEYHYGAEVISFAYDERDRIVSQCYQETASATPHVFEEYDYETLKNGERKVTARRYLDIDEAITQVTIYDAMGRQKEVYLLVDGKKTMRKEYTYYPDGALHTMTENGVTTTWQYDVQGNTISCEEPFQKENEVVSYLRTENRYDRAGRLIEASVNEPKDCGNFKNTSSFTQPVCATSANMGGLAAPENGRSMTASVKKTPFPGNKFIKLSRKGSSYFIILPSLLPQHFPL